MEMQILRNIEWSEYFEIKITPVQLIITIIVKKFLSVNNKIAIVRDLNKIIRIRKQINFRKWLKCISKWNMFQIQHWRITK